MTHLRNHNTEYGRSHASSSSKNGSVDGGSGGGVISRVLGSLRQPKPPKPSKSSKPSSTTIITNSSTSTQSRERPAAARAPVAAGRETWIDEFPITHHPDRPQQNKQLRPELTEDQYLERLQQLHDRSKGKYKDVKNRKDDKDSEEKANAMKRPGAITGGRSGAGASAGGSHNSARRSNNKDDGNGNGGTQQRHRYPTLETGDIVTKFSYPRRSPEFTRTKWPRDDNANLMLTPAVAAYGSDSENDRKNKGDMSPSTMTIEIGFSPPFEENGLNNDLLLLPAPTYDKPLPGPAPISVPELKALATAPRKEDKSARIKGGNKHGGQGHQGAVLAASASAAATAPRASSALSSHNDPQDTTRDKTKGHHHHRRASSLPGRRKFPGNDDHPTGAREDRHERTAKMTTGTRAASTSRSRSRDMSMTSLYVDTATHPNYRSVDHDRALPGLTQSFSSESDQYSPVTPTSASTITPHSNPNPSSKKSAPAPTTTRRCPMMICGNTLTTAADITQNLCAECRGDYQPRQSTFLSDYDDDYARHLEYEREHDEFDLEKLRAKLDPDPYPDTDTDLQPIIEEAEYRTFVTVDNGRDRGRNGAGAITRKNTLRITEINRPPAHTHYQSNHSTKHNPHNCNTSNRINPHNLQSKVAASRAEFKLLPAPPGRSKHNTPQTQHPRRHRSGSGRGKNVVFPKHHPRSPAKATTSNSNNTNTNSHSHGHISYQLAGWKPPEARRLQQSPGPLMLLEAKTFNPANPGKRTSSSARALPRVSPGSQSRFSESTGTPSTAARSSGRSSGRRSSSLYRTVPRSLKVARPAVTPYNSFNREAEMSDLDEGDEEDDPDDIYREIDSLINCYLDLSDEEDEVKRNDEESEVKKAAAIASHFDEDPEELEMLRMGFF
ncbi:Uu.00g093800.m01.CDS01 [Anthostomella pinea]|uniref:Uu.00g093800.m01.CDS01 n=1 Tax=Anthostomella pinea TaxID=933095 RepID=A0AAI8VNK9_9PEZI|nr:Uu.00g093800.m01.CDS01 [Anthostomella pinea]